MSHNHIIVKQRRDSFHIYGRIIWSQWIWKGVNEMDSSEEISHKLKNQKCKTNLRGFTTNAIASVPKRGVFITQFQSNTFH